tara:strand:- start:39 stop:959 length:921 start_codon:yes stop_codon:yes gene_type:complete
MKGNYVYLVTNKINGKRYIGGANGKPYYFAGGVALKKDIKKYGKPAFVKRILAFVEKDERDNIEEGCIAAYKTLQLEGGYNISPRAHGGATPTEETRRKISESNKGRPVTAETRKNLSIALTGIKRGPMSENRKKYLSIALTGRKKTEDHIKKVAESNQKASLLEMQEACIKEGSTPKAAQVLGLKTHGAILNRFTKNNIQVEYDGHPCSHSSKIIGFKTLDGDHQTGRPRRNLVQYEPSLEEIKEACVAEGSKYTAAKVLSKSPGKSISRRGIGLILKRNGLKEVYDGHPCSHSSKIIGFEDITR